MMAKKKAAKPRATRRPVRAVVPVSPAWEDITSYSKGDRGKIEPRVWKLQLPWIVLVVHRHIHYPGKWLMACAQLGLEDLELESTMISVALGEAIEFSKTRCAEYLKALESVKS